MVMPPLRIREELTGRARARKGLRRLVLQVQIRRIYFRPFDFRNPPETTSTVLDWRDATIEDLQEIPGFKIGEPKEG